MLLWVVLCLCECVCVYLDILKGDDFLTVNLHLLLDGLGVKQTIMNL